MTNDDTAPRIADARALLRLPGRIPQLAWGATVEVAHIGSHLTRYPLGLVRERVRPHRETFRLDDLPPLQRGLMTEDVEAAGTPILLVHGLVDNRTIFSKLQRTLRRRGFGRVVTMNLPLLTTDVPRAARSIETVVEALCARTGYDRIHVVGHSLGGLAARYYVQRLGGDARVHTLVTLGSPHGGTLMAHLLPRPVIGQLRPGSAIIAELAAPAPGCRTRFLALSSDLDQLVVPSDSARVDHPDLNARNVRLRGVGHTSLPFDGRAVHEIVTTLAHLDTVGHVVPGRVTPIDHLSRTRSITVGDEKVTESLYGGSGLSAPAPPA